MPETGGPKPGPSGGAGGGTGTIGRPKAEEGADPGGEAGDSDQAVVEKRDAETQVSPATGGAEASSESEP